MDRRKRNRIKRSGWAVGSAKDFLGLSMGAVPPEFYFPLTECGESFIRGRLPLDGGEGVR